MDTVTRRCFAIEAIFGKMRMASIFCLLYKQKIYF